MVVQPLLYLPCFFCLLVFSVSCAFKVLDTTFLGNVSRETMSLWRVFNFFWGKIRLLQEKAWKSLKKGSIKGLREGFSLPKAPKREQDRCGKLLENVENLELKKKVLLSPLNVGLLSFLSFARKRAKWLPDVLLYLVFFVTRWSFWAENFSYMQKFW